MFPIIGGAESFPFARYWTAGTGNTNDTAHWAFYTGGAGVASVPTALYNVRWDGNSAGGTSTFNASFACLDFDSTGYTGTLAGSAAINVGGSLTLGAGITRSFTSNITFSATSAGKTLTFNGKTFASLFIFDGLGGEWTLQDNCTGVSSGFLTLVTGTLNLNGKTVTLIGLVISHSTSARSFITGAATITVPSIGITPPAANLTADFSGSTINATGGSSHTLYGFNYNNYNFKSNNLLTLTDANSFVNLSRTVTSGYVDFSLGANQTVSGVLTVTGNNITTQRLIVKSDTPGTQRTITCNGSAALTNMDFQDIIITGSAAPIAGTSVGNAGNCSGITFTTPVTRFYISPAGSNAITSNNWSATTGGAVGDSIPICHDTLKFDGNSFAGAGRTVTTTTSGLRIGNMDWSAVTNSPTFTLSTCSWVGSSYIFASGMTQTGVVSVTISGRNACSFTSGGLSFVAQFILSNPGGSLTFQDNFTSNTLFTLSDGTLIDNGKTISVGVLGLGGSTRTRAYTKTGDLILSSSGTVLQGAATGLTWSDTAGTIKLTDNSSSNKTILITGYVFNHYWNATQGAGLCTISGSNTWNNFKIDPGRTQQFVGGNTQTVASLTISGTIGNVVTLARSSGSTQYNIILSNPAPVALDYMSISNCNFSGATVTATNSTDGGGNSGITFI